LALDGQPGADGDVDARDAPSADDRGGAVGLIPQHLGDLGAEALGHLLGDRGEHLRRRYSPRHQRRHPPQGRLLGRQLRQLVAVALQRARHLVERPLQLPDFCDADGRHPRAEVPARQPDRHPRGAANRLDDGVCQVPGEDEDEQHRGREPAEHGEHGTAGRAVRPLLTRLGQAALGSDEGVEGGAHRIHPPFAFRGRGNASSGGITAPGRVDERGRVLLDVRVRRLRDLPGGARLLGIAGGEPFERGGAGGQAPAGGVPWLQELLLPGEDEAADTRLQVDNEPLELVRRREHLLGVVGGARRLAQVGDGDEQDGERGGQDQQEQPAGEQHPAG
jgi:hypothetical protein